VVSHRHLASPSAADGQSGRTRPGKVSASTRSHSGVELNRNIVDGRRHSTGQYQPQSGQRIIRVFSASLSGDRGRPVAARRAPGVIPLVSASRGSHKPLVLPKSLKSIRRKRSVSGRRLQIAMTEIMRQRPSIFALVGELISSGMSQHVWMNREW
jgi:hypothetical protein